MTLLQKLLTVKEVPDYKTLKLRNFRGWGTLVNKDLGYAPYFSSIVRRFVAQKKACNIAVTGEAGSGKSYLASDVARILEGRTRKSKKYPYGNDRFKLNQMVFTYKEFMQLIDKKKLKMGKAIIFDEPSYAIGKREWYKDLNKALVQTIESFRFKVHPLIIPVLNKALLDKTVRSYLIQFQIEMTERRGEANVFRLFASQSTEKIYRYGICKLEYAMFDKHLCNRDSCLDCKKLTDGCNIYRAKYERKKDKIQGARYSAAYNLAVQKEFTNLTTKQLAGLLVQHRESFFIDGKIDVDLLRITSQDKLGVSLGHHKGYSMRKRLKVDFPSIFKI